MRASNGHHRGYLLSCCHCTEEPPVWQDLSAQQPGNAGGGALRRLVIGYLDSAGTPFRSPCPDRTPESPPCSDGRSAGLGSESCAPCPLRKSTCSQAGAWVCGKRCTPSCQENREPDILIRPVNGRQSKQPSQRMPGDSTPTRNSANLFLCCWDDLLGQKLQIVVRTTSAWFGILKADGLFQGFGSSPDC